MRKKRFRKGMVWLTALGCLWLAGCVTRGFHEKKLAQVSAQLSTQYKQDLADKTRRMEETLTRKNEKYKALLKKYQNNCQQRLTSLSDKNTAKARRLRRAMAYINRLEARLKDWKDLHKRLLKSFKVKIAEGSLAVKIERGLIILRMPEKVLFELGSAKLMDDGKSVVSEVARVLSQEPYRWQVAGHADPTGKASYNWDLSYRRAMAVLKVMLKHEMPPTKISAAAYGQYQPRVSNDTKAGRAQNRRTEIVFVPKIKALLMTNAKKKLSAVCPPVGSKQAS